MSPSIFWSLLWLLLLALKHFLHGFFFVGHGTRLFGVFKILVSFTLKIYIFLFLDTNSQVGLCHTIVGGSLLMTIGFL